MTDRHNTRLNAFEEAAKLCSQMAEVHEDRADLAAAEDKSREAIWLRASAEAYRAAAKRIRMME